MSGVGSSPAPATCVTSQVLLVGVSGGFSQGSVFAPPTDWPVSYELKNNLERNVKLNKKNKKTKKNNKISITNGSTMDKS